MDFYAFMEIFKVEVQRMHSSMKEYLIRKLILFFFSYLVRCILNIYEFA